MADPVLREFPNVIDCRPLGREEVFQTDPMRYAVNSNRHLYAGMSEDEAERVDRYLEETIPEGMK